MIIGLLTAAGLGQRAAKIVGYVVIPALILLAIWWAITSYGASRYDAGVRETDAKWQEASRRLERQAQQSATKADDAAADRLRAHEQQVEAEQERLDEATRNGSSPLDVLFGG